MKIIIAGSGEVGSHLAKLLSYDSKEITLIDSDDEKLSFPNNQLDIKVVEGDCTSISILNKAYQNMFLYTFSKSCTVVTARTYYFENLRMDQSVKNYR